MEEMSVEERNSGRESRHCYLEVKVPEGSAEVYRDNGPLVFYKHKTWTDSNLMFRKCWQEDEVMVIPTQKLKKLENHLKIHTHVNLGNRFIMLHVGGVSGSSSMHISFTRLDLKQETTMDK